MKTTLLSATLLCWMLGTHAQHIRTIYPADANTQAITEHSAPMTTSCDGWADMTSATAKNWRAGMYHLRHEHESPDYELIEKIRKSYPAKVVTAPNEADAANKVTATAPTLGTNFLGNELYGGTPPDNHAAVSNGGLIVSADNATIEIYNTAGQYLSFGVSLSDFVNNSAYGSAIYQGILYDPRVMYDSQNDRFIFVILHGDVAATSKVLIFVSKTNNPKTGGWYRYALNGNTSHSNCWFDYPNVGMSNNEIYITGNLFTDAGSSQGNVIFQIEKAGIYAGQTMKYQYWKDVQTATGSTAFSIMPVSFGHQGNYGPGCYFVSTSPSGSSRLYLFDLTNDMSATNETINPYNITTTAYSVGDNALQKTGKPLDVGDCRVQQAFWLNDVVHFSFTSNYSQGWNGINYNRLNTSTRTNTNIMFGAPNTADYSYPSLASFSTDVTDKTVVFTFLRSNANSYPSVRAVTCDDAGTFSSILNVKDGNSYVDLSGSGEATERWGDYCVCTRKQNAATPEVWGVACYGVNTNSYQVSNSFNAWVAQLKGPASSAADAPAEAEQVKISPNPVVEMFSVVFDLKRSQDIRIVITDIAGREVQTLFQDTLKEGPCRFVFNKAALSAGIYTLSVRGEHKVLHTEKIVVE